MRNVNLLFFVFQEKLTKKNCGGYGKEYPDKAFRLSQAK